MRKTMQRTVQAAFYSSIFLVLVAIPQLLSQALGAPVDF